jgi:hypothetical protein
MAELPKKPVTRPQFVGDSANESLNFPTFKVNVPAPTKVAATSQTRDQAQDPVAKLKGK